MVYSDIPGAGMIFSPPIKIANLACETSVFMKKTRLRGPIFIHLKL